MLKRFSIIRLVGATVLGTALLAGCTESNTPTEPTDPPLFNFSNGPANAGPLVVRFDVDEAAALFFDFDRQLVNLISADDGFSFLGCGAFTTTVLNVQDITLPSGVLVEMSLTPEGFAFVYDLASFEFSCAGFASPLAAGRAFIRSTDNDNLVTSNRPNTFGVMANGTLDLASGGTVVYNLNFRALIKKDGSFEVLQEHVQITPDPR